MIPIIRILKESVLYLVSLAAITAVVFYLVFIYGEKTFHLEKKQWRPAKPESQQIDPTRLANALEYADTRLPTARSLVLLRNGKTVVEQYYWRGGPRATDYLHSLNLPLLQVLIGIAIDHQLIQGPEQLSILRLTGDPGRDNELYRSLGNELNLESTIKLEALT